MQQFGKRQNVEGNQKNLLSFLFPGRLIRFVTTGARLDITHVAAMWGASMCKPPRRPLAWVVVPHFSHAASGSSVALRSPRPLLLCLIAVWLQSVTVFRENLSYIQRETYALKYTRNIYTGTHIHTHTKLESTSVLPVIAYGVPF